METSYFKTLFDAGTHWLRADFHLHTQADREFESMDNHINFEQEYVGKLKNENVSLGLITNHNKFDLEEFKRLRKKARKTQIFLLPGVELSVQGGRNGIHILICFEPETWIDNKENFDFINRFLDSAFPQITNRESKNTNCEWTLGQTLKALDDHRSNGRDSFLIMAHVDDDKGVLKELGAGLNAHFNDLFKESVLGFQKVRRHDNWDNLTNWLGCEWKPAKVEGSDCKRLQTIGVAHQENGNSKECWVKLGDLSYKALKFALRMKNQRIAPKAPDRQNAYIRSFTIEGKLIKKTRIDLSPDMTNLIGIRGSGKSSIIECLRYALNLPLTELTEDLRYKEDLVERALGSGGKITLELIDKHSNCYLIERILRDSPRISRDNEYIPNLQPKSLIDARYFGQKDLVRFGEKDFANDLVGRFTNNQSPNSEAIAECTNRIEQQIVQIKQFDSQLEKQEEFEAQLAEYKEVLKKFEESNLDKELKQQIALEKDLKQSQELTNYQMDTILSLEFKYNEYIDLWEKWTDYDSASKNPHFLDFEKSIRQFITEIKSMASLLERLKKTRVVSVEKLERLKSHYESQKEQFAEIRRNLNLQDDLNPDTFVDISKKKTVIETKLREIHTLNQKQQTLHRLVQKDISLLQELWHKDFKTKQNAISRLNTEEGLLQIDLSFKQDKSGFLANMKTWVQGLQSKTLEKIANHFADGIELYRDLNGTSEQVTSLGLSADQILKLKEGINANLVSVLTYRSDDKVSLNYKGKPLHSHSAGQRATALMTFLLNQKEFDLLIVDQPEDDLDNQTLYTEVIQCLLKLKGKKQIIFATHSPNIPVLGDAEQVLYCQYDPKAIKIQTGTIDSPDMQDKIVNVMEGGKDAFRKRKHIYESWKH